MMSAWPAWRAVSKMTAKALHEDFVLKDRPALTECP